MLITVAICTYRRPDSLDLALASLERQTHRGSDWEVLVVENDGVSTPAMQAVYERHKDKLPLRHVLEQRVGVSHARNTGIQHARSQYVAFFDDDEEAPEGWVATLFEVCSENRPDMGGGPFVPLYRTPKPAWFLDKYATSYMYGDKPRWLNKGEWLATGNFVVARNLCEELGGYNPAVGMKGTQMGYGEDTDLMIRAWDANPHLKVFFHPRLVIRHEVRPEKMSLRYTARLSWAAGRCSTITSPLERKQAFARLLRNAKQMLKEAWLLGQAGRRHKAERRRWQQWVFEVFHPWLWNFSRNWHALLRWRK
jgi:glucosyl-dolichyl phosphate glucuronosyltransferase